MHRRRSLQCSVPISAGRLRFRACERPDSQAQKREKSQNVGSANMATISGVFHVLLVFLGAFRCRCATTYSCSSGDIHLLVCESTRGLLKVRMRRSPQPVNDCEIRATGLHAASLAG